MDLRCEFILLFKLITNYRDVVKRKTLEEVLVPFLKNNILPENLKTFFKRKPINIEKKILNLNLELSKKVGEDNSSLLMNAPLNVTKYVIF